MQLFVTIISILRMRRSCWEVPSVQQVMPGKGCWRRMRFSSEQQEAAAVWQPAQAETAGISPSSEMLLRNVTGNTLGSSQTQSCSIQNELKQQFRMLCPDRALTWLLLLFINDGKGKVLPELHHPVLGKVNSFGAFSPADTPL